MPQAFHIAIKKSEKSLFLLFQEWRFIIIRKIYPQQTVEHLQKGRCLPPDHPDPILSGTSAIQNVTDKIPRQLLSERRCF